MDSNQNKELRILIDILTGYECFILHSKTIDNIISTITQDLINKPKLLLAIYLT